MERCKGGPGALNEPGFYNELETQRSLRSRRAESRAGGLLDRRSVVKFSWT